MTAGGIRGRLWLAGVAVLLSGPATAQSSPILNPKTYSSPSGRHVLTVDPSDRYGGGPARYSFRTDEREAWNRERALTLWDAAVTDEGEVVGYAYSFGWADVGQATGAFHVIMISPSGETLLDESVQRDWRSPHHQPPGPTARGLLVDPSTGRVVVRIGDRGGSRPEQWWVYDLASHSRKETVLSVSEDLRLSSILSGSRQGRFEGDA